MRADLYTFHCRFIADAILPPFKGSTLRGGLGHALRRTVCALKHRDCKDCLLAATCAYAFLFETGEGEAARRPHPYVLIPPEDERRDWRREDAIFFGLILFGRASDYLPHLIYSVRDMGAEGLGKKRQGDNRAGRFLLESVTCNNRTIYTEEKLLPGGEHSELKVENLPAEQQGVKRIVLHCLTPLRVKADNRLQEALPFQLLIRAALRRISSLESHFGEGEPPLDYKGLAASATEVRVVSADCRWQEIERYSNRQKSAMHFGGIVGQIAYEGEALERFLPLLRYGETVHLGKQTSFGLGRIQVEVLG